MKSKLVTELALLVLLFALLKFLLVPRIKMLVPRIKGWAGERIMVWLLRKLDPRQYRVLNDIYLPKPDGTTTQIDHIVVSAFGVFVIETKTYRGWIFGDADSKVWTQSICARGFRTPIKNTFQNPLHQNYAHLCTIENCTGIPKDVMRSVIAFSGEATFKTERPAGVLYFGDVVNYIRQFTTPVIQHEQVGEIVDVILGWQATLTKKQVASHVKNLKARHDGVGATDSAPRCPRCGAPMVRRTSKSGGDEFYGCPNYPKCRAVVKINA